MWWWASHFVAGIYAWHDQTLGLLLFLTLWVVFFSTDTHVYLEERLKSGMEANVTKSAFSTFVLFDFRIKFPSGRKRYFFLFAVLSLFFFFLGHRYTAVYFQKRSSTADFPVRLDCQTPIKTVPIVGRVLAIQRSDPQKEQLIVETDSIENHPIKTKLRLFCYYCLAPPWKLGEYWQWFVKLKALHARVYPGSTSASLYNAYTENIRVQGSIVNQKKYPWQPIEKGGPARIDLWRERFTMRVHDALFNAPVNAVRVNAAPIHAAPFNAAPFNAAQVHTQNPPPFAAAKGILLALILGVRSEITPSMWKVFQRTNTSHLMAISGLHIGFVATLIFFIVRLGLGFLPGVLLWCPAQKIAAILSAMVGVLYAWISGFSLPAARASIMSILFFSNYFTTRQYSFAQRLLWAWILLSVLYPLTVFSASFCLSFLAVTLLLTSTAFMNAQWSSWKKTVFLQGVFTLGLLPCTCYFFLQAPLFASWTNFFAIPWIGFVILPLGVLGLIVFIFSQTAGTFVLKTSAVLLEPLWQLLLHISQWPYLVWEHPIPTTFVFFLATASVILFLFPKHFPGKKWGLFFLMPLFFYKQDRVPPSAFHALVLDVGQGLSVLVRTATHTLLYDAGPKFGDFFDAGLQTIVPTLHFYQIDKLDQLMISHDDSDHMGGASSVVSALRVQSLLTSAPQEKLPPVLKNIFHHHCVAGEKWQWDGVDFEILAPEEGLPYQKNKSSCVLKISVGKQSLLLPGDMEHHQETGLLKQHIAALPATCLVAAHHGSKTSSSWSFVQAVHPKIVVYATGFCNRFHFPSSVVRSRYQQVGASELDTARDGTISLYFDQQGTYVR